MKADAYLAVSEHVRNAHIEFGLPPGAIRVLPNAVKDLQQDVSAAAQTPIRPAKKLVYAGAIIEAKGVFVLCHLANTLPEFEFHLLGDGEDFRRLERQISAMQLPNIVLHASKINGDKVAIWSDAFLTVIPSLWNEPFGLCAAESFSLGIPVATTGSGGLSEIITHDQNGMVLDFSDPENVATQIRELWDNSRTYAQLRENARHTFETRYTEDVYSRNLSMALTDIIEERGAAQ
jgi:glycosyltransferase involved in cell wall biosynthesis